MSSMTGRTTPAPLTPTVATRNPSGIRGWPVKLRNLFDHSRLAPVVVVRATAGGPGGAAFHHKAGAGKFANPPFARHSPEGGFCRSAVRRAALRGGDCRPAVIAAFRWDYLFVAT